MAFGSIAAAVAGSVISSAIGANAATSAADTQAGANRYAADIQKQMFDTINSQEQPFREAGQGATSALSNMLGIGTPTDSSTYGALTRSFTPTDFFNNLDPGYGWQLEQGRQALQNSQAATNGVLSGAALKDLIGYNQGMASTAYQGAFNRFQTQQGNIFQRLSALATLGQNAAANTGTQGAALATGMGANIANMGAAQAAGIVGSANAITGGINNVLGYGYLNRMLSNSQPVAHTYTGDSGYTLGYGGVD